MPQGEEEKHEGSSERAGGRKGVREGKRVPSPYLGGKRKVGLSIPEKREE